MSAIAIRFGTAALALGAVIILVPRAAAQVRVAPNLQRLFPVNPNPYIAPGVKLQQYAYNTAVLGRAYSQIPPYMLGYNPYPLGVNYGPVYNPQVFQPSMYNPYATPLVPPGVPYGGYSPYAGNPYGGGYSAGGIDPLTGLPTGGGYNPYSSNPSYWNPYSGGYNYGSAMELMAYGQVGLNQEQARILREQANQAKLDTRKKLVDTMAYIRANEYTFTQEQQDIAKKLLDRVQKTPTQTEVQSGKSLNVMLADLTKLNNQPFRGPTVTLDDDVLKLVNVCGPGSNGNIGLLRNDGRFGWAAAFDDKSVATDKERKDIELEAQQLYQQANNGGKLDPNTLKDLESGLRTLHANLTKQVNTLPIGRYLEAKRFLDDFDAAVAALKKGDVALNSDFLRFAKGGKTVQEIVDFMGSKGLKFASACNGDERAYTALQAAFSAHSLAVHAQIASSGKG